MTERRGLRVLVADDDPFIVSMIAEGLRTQGFAVATATSTEDAWKLIELNEPHALVSDLSFGPNESAAALLKRVRETYPWVGLVILTSHKLPKLAIHDADLLPSGVVYLVKTELTRLGYLSEGILEAIGGQEVDHTPTSSAEFVLTDAQADVLRMLAEGASTSTIAQRRGTSARAAEMIIARVYASLHVDDDEGSNARTAAVRLWQQGRVTIA